MKKIIMVLIVCLMAGQCFARRGGIGTLVGAGIGAVAGEVTKEQIVKAQSKDYYNDENVFINGQFVDVKFEDGTMRFRVQDENKSFSIGKTVKMLNVMNVTKLANWTDHHDTISICNNDNVCANMVIDINENKNFDIGLVFEGSDETLPLVSFETQEPGVLNYVWNFVLNNIVLVFIIACAIIGFIVKHFKKD
ncbi:MAG: hypothetical protein HUJ68_12715 [Clostridia bacterium]|nr:hypothetical protein [Clostridia bacterium]